MAGITIERILALNAAYIRCIDRDELEAWPDFFLDPCLYVVTSAENHRAGFEGGMIYADTRGMLVDRVASLRGANVYEKQSYRHILGLPSVLKNGGDEADTEKRPPDVARDLPREHRPIGRQRPDPPRDHHRQWNLAAS